MQKKVDQFHEIRVNQNAVKVVAPDAVCEQLKASPAAVFHAAQREPAEWGRHDAEVHEHTLAALRVEVT